MRLPSSPSSLAVAHATRLGALALVALLAGCGGGNGSPGDGGVSCTKSRDCGTGQGCVQGVCQDLPCGGCQPDEVCADDGSCKTAQGASCPTLPLTCPSAYPCKGSACAKVCTLDHDCDTGFVCNSATGACAQCVFDSQCTSVAGKPFCNGPSGNCVECTQAIQCTQRLGSGHYCDSATHTCAAACKTDNDCNLGADEKCDGATASTPGRCIQCKTDLECVGSAKACDPTGHCVACTEKKYCGGGTPECDTDTKTCVECVTANNPNGKDCGYAGLNGVKDPHDAMTCDPVAKLCVNGCKSDAQCGCPRNGGVEANCLRNPDQEHCDPAKASMAGVAGATLGGCVQCTTNTHCAYKVIGKGGGLNGARCVNDSCQAGCDTDTDCPADKLCDLTNNAHRCVQCSCAGKPAGPDSTWCDDPKSAHGALPGGCGVTNLGAQLVCDVTTLLCRQKRARETCQASNECGDAHDPTIGVCLPFPSICVFTSHSGSGSGGNTCCANARASGRCGIPCDDLNNNTCNGSDHCPSGMHCRQATGEDTSHVGTYCVPDQCNVTSGCPQ